MEVFHNPHLVIRPLTIEQSEMKAAVHNYTDFLESNQYHSHEDLLSMAKNSFEYNLDTGGDISTLLMTTAAIIRDSLSEGALITQFDAQITQEIAQRMYLQSISN